MRITRAYISERTENNCVQLAISAQLLSFSNNADLVKFVVNHPLCKTQSVYAGIYQLANTVSDTEKRKFLNFILSLSPDDKQLSKLRIDFLYCHLLARNAEYLVDLQKQKPLTYEKWQVLAKMFNVKKRIAEVKELCG